MSRPSTEPGSPASARPPGRLLSGGLGGPSGTPRNRSRVPLRLVVGVLAAFLFVGSAVHLGPAIKAGLKDGTRGSWVATTRTCGKTGCVWKGNFVLPGGQVGETSVDYDGRLPVSLHAGTSVPALAVGVPLGRYYQLYYVFPFTQQQSFMALIQRVLVGVGLALVVLLAAIASLVTRWVVLPVRHAAQAAQRLSAGHLEERMQVLGVDDLAALATSFNEMAASLQAKLAELEDLSSVQRQFVSDVSHELRAPLTTIRMAADLLFESRQELDPVGGRSVELLQSQLERFETMVVDLLEISRYDAGAATLEADLIDVCDLVRRSADDAQQLAERKGSRIEFRLPATGCFAEVDRRRVERILRNILVNAVEHGDGKDVVVTAAIDSAAVAVSVRDYGVGLRPGEQQRVFERFWRADPARARTTGGTGLGLAISLEDALLHGGWLQAWGERGKGSVFRLTLPRVVGQDLAGSPLPLGPDEAELAAGLGAAEPYPSDGGVSRG